MSRPIRAVLAVDEGLDSDDLVALFGGDETLRLAQVTRLDDAPRVLAETQADLLVVAAQGYSDRALFLVDRAVKADPDRPVLVLSHASPNGFVRRVFEVGGEDILMLPQSPQQLQFAVQKALARRKGGAAAQGADLGRLIAVLGPKGGTGKTLTSANLAVALAQRGMRTAIVDLDLQFGDVGLCMGLPPDLTMYDLALAGGTIDVEKLDAYLVDASLRRPRAAGAEPSRPGRHDLVSRLLQDVYGALRSNYYIVIDTPPGFTPEVIASIDASTDLVMVGMLDSLSLKNTKLGLETLELMGYDRDQIRLVLNRAHSRVGISPSDVVAVLGREPDIFIPSDREIPRAVNEGVPIVLPIRSPSPRPRSASSPISTSAPVANHCRDHLGRKRPQSSRASQERGPRWNSTSDCTSTATPDSGRAGAGPFADLKNQIHMRVIGELGPQLSDVDRPGGAARARRRRHRAHLADEVGISRDDRERLTGEITDDILGYGPFERLLADDTITEIMVNGPDEIWIERQGRLYETTVRFNDDSHLRRIINKIVAQVGRRIDEASPMVDARLPDGTRVNAIIPPLSLSGPLLTIRKFSQKRLCWTTCSPRHAVAEAARLPAALRPGRAQHHHLAAAPAPARRRC